MIFITVLKDFMISLLMFLRVCTVFTVLIIDIGKTYR
jgi:hypothetical protein